MYKLLKQYSTEIVECTPRKLTHIASVLIGRLVN